MNALVKTRFEGGDYIKKEEILRNKQNDQLALRSQKGYHTRDAKRYCAKGGKREHKYNESLRGIQGTTKETFVKVLLHQSGMR